MNYNHLRLVFAAGFLLLAPMAAFAQYDSVYVETKNDTVTIWNTKAAPENCLARFKFTVTASNDTVSVIETDTAGVIGTCESCLFNLSVSIVHLSAGNYRAMVYRQYLRKYGYPVDTTVFINSAPFAVTSSSSGALSYAYFQSQCVKDAIRQKPNQTLGYSLFVNYPNPFNPQTIITYSIPVSELVSLKVFDALGREIRMLVSERQTPGTHSVTFDGGNLPSGVYFYRLQAGSYSATRKLVLLK